MSYQVIAIRNNRELAPGIRSMEIPWEIPVLPGQFFMLRREGGGTLLPRAISVCDWSGGVLRFCYQVVGRGTGELAGMSPEDLLHVTGPLGNGFPVDALSGRIALVAGGIGAAPMVHTARALRERGLEADCFAGFRDTPFLVEELREHCGAVLLATESGREGHKGFVTGLLRPQDYAAALCCGPEPMMKAVTALFQQAGVPIYVSLENKMACGLGACLVCTCTDRNGHNRRTCKEGPVFRGEEIDFDA